MDREDVRYCMLICNKVLNERKLELKYRDIPYSYDLVRWLRYLIREWDSRNMMFFKVTIFCDNERSLLEKYEGDEDAKDALKKLKVEKRLRWAEELEREDIESDPHILNRKFDYYVEMQEFKINNYYPLDLGIESEEIVVVRPLCYKNSSILDENLAPDLFNNQCDHIRELTSEEFLVWLEEVVNKEEWYRYLRFYYNDIILVRRGLQHFGAYDSSLQYFDFSAHASDMGIP